MNEERPRDRLGRPLPRGTRPDPNIPPVPDVTGRSDAEVLARAWAFVADGLPFHAHEVCEQRWRESAEPDRDLWRALAQWGAAETHAARGNAEGARRLAARALTVLAPDAGTGDVTLSGLDSVVMRCRTLA